MLFDVQEDRGSSLSAYLVPDAGGSIPVVRVMHDGKAVLTLMANQPLPALVAAGRHTTGQCGFMIDETLVPGLSSFADLELIEPETGLLIYRRPTVDAIEGLKMFRLETHLLPLWRLDDVLRSRFHMWYKGIDRFGLETSTQVLCLSKMQSIFSSGRLLYKNYEFYLRKGIKTISLIRDPYEELAERLLVLQNIGDSASKILGARDAMVFAPVMEFLAETDELNDVACQQLFKKAPKPVIQALTNPLSRQLTASTPDQIPQRSAVAVALEVLSSFDLVGLRSRSADFSGALAETIGIDEQVLPPLGEHPRVITLGNYLRSSAIVEAFLEQDLELYHFVISAFDAIE